MDIRETDVHRSWEWTEDDKWKFLTNVAPEYFDPEYVTQEEVIDDIVTKYGAENVKVSDSAYDRDRNLISGFKAVFVKYASLNKT